MSGSKPLTSDEKRKAFCRATSDFAIRYALEIAQGMTDEQLVISLKDYLGIFGGSGGPDMIDVSYQGAGLKIWADRTCPNHVLEQPIFKGSQTVRMARHIYNIPDPSDTQLSLI